MDRLSSCYFCGDALDATLEEHPVVPSNLHPDPESQKSVVLCSSCRQKLEVVLETVVDAVERDTADVTAVEGGDQPSESGGGSPAEDLESTLGDDEEILTSLDSDDGSADETADAAEASKMEFGDDRAASESGDGEDTDESESNDRSDDTKYTESRGAGFRRDDDGPVESGSLTGGAFSDDDDESPESESLTGGAFDDEDDDATEPTESRDRSGSSDSNDTSRGSSPSGQRDTGSGSESNDPDGSTTERDVSMSRLENTKVMRLLENREFPVEKDEFVTVAANAYQISRDDCEKVLALAVEHGLLREDDGQLYDGDA